MACEGERLEGALITLMDYSVMIYELRASMSYELSNFVLVVSCVPVRLRVYLCGTGGGACPVSHQNRAKQ